MAKDLNKIASECLAFNKHFEKVYVTSDGVPFQHKNDAVNHAKRLTEKEIKVFERGGENAEGSKDASAGLVYAMNAKDTIKLIGECTSIEAVELLLAGDERSTVKAAGEKQIAELKQKALDEQAAAADKAREQRENENPKDPAGTEALGNGKSESE